MKPDKAVENLKNLRLFMILEDKQNVAKFTKDNYEAIELAIQALEKQIPKKPTIIDYKKYIGTLKNAEFLRDAYWCPNCRQAIKCGTFCNKCGQRLDWIEESEE